LESLLEKLYLRVHLTSIVLEELRAQGAPEDVQRWAFDTPAWVDVHDAPTPTIIELDVLDPGERSAIQLAMQLDATLLLIDERKAGLVAQTLGFAVTGTLGVLRDAHIAGMIDAREAYDALTAKTNFRQTKAVRQLFIRSLRA
jgi:predicted nucleic acid-binding protein